jgi:hypothetical protein
MRLYSRWCWCRARLYGIATDENTRGSADMHTKWLAYSYPFCGPWNFLGRSDELAEDYTLDN